MIIPCFRDMLYEEEAVIDTADVAARVKEYKEYLLDLGLSWRQCVNLLVGLTEDQLSAVLSSTQNRPWKQLTPPVQQIYARMDCWMNTRHLGLLIKLIRLPCTILHPKLINVLTINQVGAVQLGTKKRMQQRKSATVVVPARARSKSRTKIKPNSPFNWEEVLAETLTPRFSAFAATEKDAESSPNVPLIKANLWLNTLENW